MSQQLKHKLKTTEKTESLRSQNKIVLVTNKSVTQSEIVALVEGQYQAKVTKVNSLVLKGKFKVRKRALVKMPDRKKFYLTLENVAQLENGASDVKAV